jgi:methionyl-tRNA synthetase
MLSFAYKRFDGKVPEPGPLDGEDRALLEKVEAGFETVGELYNACKFRAALGEALALAREANGYLDRKAPWFQIKEDRDLAATSVYVILRAVDNLKTLLAPILPHTPVLRTGHSSCTSTWAMTGSSSARSTWSSTRKRRAATRR